jgi:hypothetical protein
MLLQTHTHIDTHMCNFINCLVHACIFLDLHMYVYPFSHQCLVLFRKCFIIGTCKTPFCLILDFFFHSTFLHLCTSLHVSQFYSLQMLENRVCICIYLILYNIIEMLYLIGNNVLLFTTRYLLATYHSQDCDKCMYDVSLLTCEIFCCGIAWSQGILTH